MKRSAILLCLILTGASFAQHTEEQTIPSAVFGRGRRIDIWLPPGYDQDSLRKFPVAYLLDGQFRPYFEMVSGTMSYYSQTNFGLEMILVSVHTEDRFGEFVPEEKTGADGQKIYATPLTEFMEKELFPFVGSNYRAGKFRLGIGHSLGGTFLLHEAFREGSPFDAVIAASPNTAVNRLPELMNDYAMAAPSMTTFLFVTTGDADETEQLFLETTLRADSAMTARRQQFPDWNFRRYANANHMETFPRSFDEGYLLLSRKWYVTRGEFAAFGGLQGEPLAREIKKALRRVSTVRKEEAPYSAKMLLSLQTIAAHYGDYRTAADINTLSVEALKADSALAEGRAEMMDDLIEKGRYYQFQVFCAEAEKAAASGDYELAAQEYLCALENGPTRGTIMQRIASLEVLARTGRTDEAFAQIDLLAYRFELGGSYHLTENPLLAPLHADKRWAEYMAVLECERRKIPPGRGPVIINASTGICSFRAPFLDLRHEHITDT
jgi:predicted alpha/beta superfamily hydrolase